MSTMKAARFKAFEPEMAAFLGYYWHCDCCVLINDSNMG
jgi:hypothetical protein